MKTPTIQEQAFALGKQVGTNAAEWFCQDAIGGRSTRDDRATATRILAQIEDGDPEFWGDLILPDLSGEWSDGETPNTLAESLGIDTDDDQWLFIQDEVCSSWEQGVSDGFTDEVCRACHVIIDERED